DAEPTPRPSGNVVTRNSYAVTYLSGRIDELLREVHAAPNWRDYYLDLFRDERPGWHQAQASIAALKEACDEARVPLLLVNYPELHQTKNYPLQPISDKVQALARRFGIPYLDLLPVVADENDPRWLWVNATDAHPNGFANARYAGRIAT